MFMFVTSHDSMRYDFIQHYIAYHRAKIHELDDAMAPFHTPATLINAPPDIQHLNQMQKMHSKKYVPPASSRVSSESSGPQGWALGTHAPALAF